MDSKKLGEIGSMTDKENEIIEDAQDRLPNSLRANSSNLLFKFYKSPKKKVRKYIKKIKKKRKKPKFIGWGMQTLHELPWSGGIDNEIFIKAAKDVKSFKFASKAGWYADLIDQLLWRHWIVSFSIRYVMKFTKERDISLVECGVAYGVSASFALRELQDKKNKGRIDQFYMHLYDAWEPTKKYGEISVELTKENLSEFAENVICHEGYIPESLSISPPPEKLVFLHIDLNSAPATLAALDFFYPRLHDRGIILFDDYGWESYIDTKKVVDEFFVDKHGILMPLPTGQAIFFR